ncbi:hypothetical protein AZE42_01239, partial [Rhizopogon vesiculosus]
MDASRPTASLLTRHVSFAWTTGRSQAVQVTLPTSSVSRWP